jgi:phospholipid/cholesterol/gamma-HCH transport system substrate-binding protein
VLTGELTTRTRNILSGAIALLLVMGATVVGVKYAFGAFSGGYKISADFDAAGQGLAATSDVKIRGVNVGKVTSVELRDGRARVTMRIKDGEDVPTTTEAVVRPKTLFGEKFVDLIPGSGEAEGPYLEDGDEIPNEQTTGGFELERVLADAFPLLDAINPDELMTVVRTLADSGDGLGEIINRGIVNNAAVLEVQARHDADVRKFLADLAAFADELGDRGDDLTAAARDLNVALPTLADNSDALNDLLVQTGRLSGDLADLLIDNQPTIDAAFNTGQATLDVLSAHVGDVIPTVTGLRQYIQTLTQAARIPTGKGTSMAAVKGLLGGDVCELFTCDVAAGGGALAASAREAPPALEPRPGITLPSVVDLIEPLTSPAEGGLSGIVELLGGLLRGGAR